MIATLIGGFGLAMTWAAKQEYIKGCSEEETRTKNEDIFTIIFGFSAILASLFALSLLNNSKARIGLYVILTLLVLNALMIQICNSCV